MCWACYTPLTAGAGAAMSAGVPGGATTFPRSGTMPGAGPGAGAGPAPAGEGEKKKVDPRLFLIGGGLLFAGFVTAYNSGMIGGSTPAISPIDAPLNVATSSGFPGTISSSSVPPPPPVPPPAPSAPQDPQRPLLPPPADAYTVFVPPSTHYTTATLAITPNAPLTSNGAAVSLAKKARLNLQQSRRWTNFQIVVYSDGKSAGAGAFQQYMNDRRGAPLNPQNYSELASKNAWSGAVIYYESMGGSEHVFQPSGSPNWSPSSR